MPALKLDSDETNPLWIPICQAERCQHSCTESKSRDWIRLPFSRKNVIPPLGQFFGLISECFAPCDSQRENVTWLRDTGLPMWEQNCRHALGYSLLPSVASKKSKMRGTWEFAKLRSWKVGNLRSREVGNL